MASPELIEGYWKENSPLGSLFHNVSSNLLFRSSQQPQLYIGYLLTALQYYPETRLRHSDAPPISPCPAVSYHETQITHKNDNSLISFKGQIKLCGKYVVV